eukprot:SAG31_NODE_1587_length_7819_cov_3.703277_1_plen_108_part_00
MPNGLDHTVPETVTATVWQPHEVRVVGASEASALGTRAAARIAEADGRSSLHGGVNGTRDRCMLLFDGWLAHFLRPYAEVTVRGRQDRPHAGRLEGRRHAVRLATGN